MCLTNHLKKYADLDSSLIEWDWNENQGSITNLLFRIRKKKSLQRVTHFVVKRTIEIVDKERIEALLRTAKECSHLQFSKVGHF